MVRVYVLGGLRVESEDDAASVPASHKTRLLLGLLAVERRVHGRSELAGRLWPDVREDSARASLRNALAQLRRALGSAAERVLVVDGGGVALAAEVWTDLGEVERLLAVQRVEAALERCAGQVLAGFDEDWVQQRRDELRDRLVGALVVAAAAAEGAGDLEAAVRLSRHSTALDLLGETSHRDLIRRLAAVGDRGAALAAYERLRERLAVQLRIAPSAATRALAAELRGERPSPAERASASAGGAAEAAGLAPAPSKVRYARHGEHTIAYQRFGSGPVDLLVIPGWGSNLDEIWGFPPLGPMLSRLGEFARCVVFDKRGTGLSERDLDFGGLEERADDIRAVMDAAGLARASLFAYSESAALAIVLAASHPERVDRLVLYSSYARLLSAPNYAAGFPPEVVDAFVERIRRDWGAGRISRVSFQGVPETSAAERMLGRWERSVCTPTIAADIIRRNADIDVRSLLPAVEAPTLVLHSRGDPIAPPALGRYVAERIPRARYVDDDAGYHLLWDGGSAWFLEQIEECLTGQPTSGRAGQRFLSTILCVRSALSTKVAQEDEVRRFGAEVVASTSEELVAIIDSPSRAVACAATIHAAAVRCGEHVALGIHTGELERLAGGVTGAGLDVARAVAAYTHAGEILVSRTVRDLTTGSGLRFVERGRRELPGARGESELFAYRPSA
jgi:DNA-binding SARP family transcriptional activator/pimeloyl-ACP methyl ester carboxylesterase